MGEPINIQTEQQHRRITDNDDSAVLFFTGYAILSVSDSDIGFL